MFFNLMFLVYLFVQCGWFKVWICDQFYKMLCLFAQFSLLRIEPTDSPSHYCDSTVYLHVLYVNMMSYIDIDDKEISKDFLFPGPQEYPIHVDHNQTESPSNL